MVAPLLALAAFAGPSFALTPPALQLADNLGDIITIDSTGTVTAGGSCTASSCKTTTVAVASGSVTWTGTIGPFSVFSASGQTKPALASPNIDVAVGSVQTAATGGTLTISWTDVGFTGSGPAYVNETTTFTSGSGSVIYNSYVDNTNVPFGTGILIATVGPTTSGALIAGPGPTVDPFSMTGVEAITMAPNTVFLNDYGISASPAPALALSCAVASGQVGVPYSSGLVVTGGVAPYSYSISSGSLPTGLLLNASTGAITGTPTTSGPFNFTAKVMDSSGITNGNTATSSCGITIASPPPTLACPAITTGQAGLPYSSSLAAMGGVSPYTFSISAGALPTGLFLNANTGAISGTPSASGGFSFTAKVLDSAKPTGNTTTASCSFSIAAAPAPMTLSCAASTGTVGQPYSSSLSASGGTAPYTFKIISGALPTGLTLAATGAITGTPTSATTFNFTWQVTDSSGNSVSGTAQKSCAIAIGNAQVLPLSLNCPLGTATVGAPYSSSVTAIGGLAPYTFSVAAGSLPAGLVLNTATGAITGTPTIAGTTGFTIKVVDSRGTSATSTCTGSCSGTATASINFNSPTGNLGNSKAYPVSGLTITAYGYNNSGSAASLDGQNNSGIQNDGIGIASTSNGQIDTSHFVQLDFSQAIAAGATNGQILISGLQQCQYGESYDIYGSNTPGSIGTLLVGAGTQDTTYIPIPNFGTYKYISVRAHWGNVLIGDISFTLPGTSCSITVAPAPVSKVSISKKANVSTANPFQKVTYTYTVTNNGGYPLTNITVTDDNATPSYTGDDFTVGTVASLAPGASATLTATVIPPVTEGGTPQNWNWSGGWNSWGNTSPAGTLICNTLPNGNVQVTWRQDPGQTDNTYGRGTSSNWGGQSRNFSDMLAWQAAEFRFLDKNGNTVLDIAEDYISPSSKYPSGYGTMGISAGYGGVISGSGSHVVSCDTTLSHNLNQSPGFYQCTKDSPTSSSWDYVSGYTVVVDSGTFGSAGFGGVAIPECHNQNSMQWGCNDMKVSPVSSTVTNTATVTATGNGVTVTATAQATVKIDASQSGWGQCNKY